MLKKIIISQFKSIAGFEEELNKVNVLVGSNNSGKSSILQAIHFAVAIAQSRRRLKGEEEVIKGETSFSIAPQQIIYSPMDDVISLGHGGKLTQKKGIQVDFHFINGHEGNVKVNRGKNRNLSIVEQGDHVISRIEDLSQPFSVYVPGLAGISKHESFIARGQLLRAVARGDANLVLRNVLHALHSSERNRTEWDAFSSALAEVFPKLAIHIAFSMESDEFIDVSLSKNGGDRLPIDAYGTGVLQTIQILSYIYLFKPAVTLLDEPDSHLHPNNQRALAILLQRLTEEGLTQILMATHSRHVLDVLKGHESVKTMWIRAGATQSMREHIDILTELGALDSAEGLFGRGIHFVMLTEDSETKWMSLLLESNGAVPGTYQIWGYKGCSRTDVANTVAKFIREVSPQTTIIVHRDADYLKTEEMKYYSDINAHHGLKTFFPPTTDMEGIYCRLSHLKMVNTGFENDVEEAFNKALATSKNEFVQSAERGRGPIENDRYKRGDSTESKVGRETWAEGLDYLTHERWRHGKKFLSAIRREFRDKTKRELKVQASSEFLEIAELRDLLRRAKLQNKTTVS